jgi:hypothetical protein
MPRLDSLSDDDLARLWVLVMDEMRDRGMVRSANNPVADRAERVVADLYGVEPIGGSNPGYDVVTKRGEKVQVKGLRMTDARRSTLSPVRSPDYDYLIAVRFERGLHPQGRLALFPSCRRGVGTMVRPRQRIRAQSETGCLGSGGAGALRIRRRRSRSALDVSTAAFA